MTATMKLRRVAVPTVFVTTLLSTLSTAQTSTAQEFQMRAAINDNRNEVVDSTGWTKDVPLTASDKDGERVDILMGQTYRLEISGTFVYANNQLPTSAPRIADAECSIDPESSRSATANQWQSERWSGYSSDLLDVLVKNSGSLTTFRWIPIAPYLLSTEGEPQCSSVNRYYADVTPAAWYLTFLVDDRYWLDNAGSLKITVSRGAFSASRIYEGKGYQCPKWVQEAEQLDPTAKIGGIDHAGLMLDTYRDTLIDKDPAAKDEFGNHKYAFNQNTGHWGMYTCNWSLPDTSYRITVSGVWKYEQDAGNLALADAECATGAANLEKTWASTRTDKRSIDTWMDQRYVDTKATTATTDDFDYLDLFINRDKTINWIPMYPDPSNPACSGDANHTYYIDWTPDRTGPIMFEPGDWEYAEQDNIGMLCIHVERHGAAQTGHAAPEAEPTHDILTAAQFTTGLGG